MLALGCPVGGFFLRSGWGPPIGGLRVILRALKGKPKRGGLYIAWGNKDLPTLHTRIELFNVSRESPG